MKKNLPLIVGLALPFVFILLIAVVVYLPNVFIKPQHDFLYTMADRNNYNYNTVYKNTYAIENGGLVQRPVELPKLNENDTRVIIDAPKLYRYNVKDSTNKEISFTEAQSLKIDVGPSSPDGYIVAYRYNHNGVFELFGSNGNNSGYFISKGKGGKKLIGLDSAGYYYENNFTLLGWIK
ncbi:MAG: hypothetical protein V4519_01295 [Patescibacteria group bacterium]